MQQDDFSSDELLELLDQFKCRSKINKDNAREVVTEIARQEIIQKPHLMSSQGAKSRERPKMNFRRAHLVDGQDLFLWLVLSFSDKNPLTVLKKKLALFFFRG